jgi:hypothetical protein
MSVSFIDGCDTVESTTKVEWEFGPNLNAVDLNLQCGLHISIDKIRPAVIHVDDIDKAECTFDVDGNLSTMKIIKPENGVIMIDSMEKLLEVFGKPDATISFDVNTMYPHVIRIERVENVDSKMQKPYVQGLDYITLDFKTVKEGSSWENVNDQEEECADQEETTGSGLCEELPLICRSQWDSIRSREQSICDVPENGIQRFRPLDVRNRRTATVTRWWK